MNPFCPNLSNPQVKKEFNELVDIFGEDVAYFLWDKNEGYGLDKAPSGEPSKLFLSHLSEFNGNRIKSIKATAKDIINGKNHDSAQQLAEGLDQFPKGAKEAIEQVRKRIPDAKNLSDNDIYNVLLQARDLSLKDEYDKHILAPINKELEQHLISLLEPFHITIDDIENFITDDESIKLEQLAGLFDIYNKIIYVSKNRNEITLPEEFAHAFIRLMGIKPSKDENFKALYKGIEKTDIFQRVYEEYKDVYVYHNTNPYTRERYTVPNMFKIKEEAIGQALAALIIAKWNSRNVPAVEKTFAQKLKSYVMNIFDMFAHREKFNFDKTLTKLADQIINGNLEALNKVDASDYNLLNFEDTIERQNKKDGGTALRLMQYMCNLGNHITGSLSYRLQGTLYRSNQDSLHDIDMTVPFSVHNITPFSFHFETIENQFTGDQLRTVMIDNMEQEPYFQKILKDYPNMRIFTAYWSGTRHNGYTVSSVWSEDVKLAERFAALKHMSVAEKLDMFTQEERDKLYIFDFFLELQDYANIIDIPEYGINVTGFEKSLIPKALMGRPKDCFDYQRWQVFEKYKYQFIPQMDHVLLQKKPTSHDELNIVYDMEEFIVQKLSEYMNLHPDLSERDINIKRRELVDEYVQNRQRSIMSDSAIALAEAFGLTKQGDGTWASFNANDPIAKLRVEFVNSIDPEHSGSYDHNSMSISAHHIIRIGLDKGDPTTFNHEMAHHYVRMFWNSELIQAALDIVSKPGMSDIEREEVLVDKMVEISIDNVYGTIFNNSNFFHLFWNKFANMLYATFNIKTNTVRKQLLQNVTDAFILNEQLSAIEDERQLFNMHQGTVYQKNKAVQKFNERKQKKQNASSYRAQNTNKDEELAESIIKHTENKDKAYSRRGGINEQQVLRLQEAVYAVHRSSKKISEAITAGRIEDAFHEKANLILDYMDRAVEEIADSVRAFESAMANNYKQFVYNLNPDGTVLYTPQGRTRKDITFEDLVNIKSDILNFHANLIGKIGDMFADIESTKNFTKEDIQKIKDKYLSLGLNNQISKFESCFNNALDKACIRDIIKYIDENVVLEDDLKTRLKINTLKWLRDQNDYGDVSIYEQWIGLGSHSKSPIIRIMQDIINDMLYERDAPVLKKGQELNDLLNKARKSTTSGFIDVSKYNIKVGKFNIPTPWNIQKLLMEVGENGLPTGNLISKLNRGKYFKNKEDFMAELLYGKDGNGGVENKIRTYSVNGTIPYKDFELELDKYATPIFPEDSGLEDIFKEYYKEVEKWRCANEDRQYTEKYYMDRIDQLSVKTLRAMDQIQSQVGEIYSICTINGVVRTDLLTSWQKDDLRALRAKRAQLYNFYNEDGTLKPDGSDEKQIAEELAKWSLKTRGKIQYKIDNDGFQKALSLAKNKQRFYEDNTELVINPKVWEFYNRQMKNPLVGHESDPDIEKLNKLIYVRNKMLAQVKSNGFGFTNMSELWDDNTKTIKNRDFWVNLRSIETSIYRLRQILKDKYRTTSKATNKQNFGKIFNSIYNPINENGPWFGNNVPRWVNHIHRALRSTSPDDIKLLYLEGTSEPLSIFSTLIPYYHEENGKKIQVDEFGQKYEIFIRVPNSNFSILDVEKSSDEYVNKSYKNPDKKTYMPKESIYKNKEFEKFEKPGALKDLYDAVLATMNESWSKFPFLHEYDYRLPQMRGRTGQILGRRRNVFKSIGYQFSSWWEINETDEWMNNDYQTRPDGSRIDFVPIRFIKRLERPEYISSDVVGSTISFFEMAKNFEVKSKVASQFEAYLTKFEQNDERTKQTWHNVSQSKILSHMTDVQLYGREQELVVDSKKNDRHGDTWAKNAMKRIKASRGWAQASLLAHNYASAIVSFLDPLLSLTLDMATGKFVNYRDLGYAVGVILTDIPRAFRSLGSVRTYSKANAAMQYFQLGKNNNTTFKNLDKSQFYRFMSDDLGMKLFTVGDYTISCLTMISTMNNYKLYEYKDSSATNPHKKFLKKEEFISEAIKDGRTEEEAKDMYNKWFSHTSLWNAFELKNGQFVVKDKFKAFVDDQTMKNVRKQAQSRSSIYNGVVPDSEKTRLQTNIWTSFITMLRNFFIMGISERFKNLRDFQVADYELYQQNNLNIENGELINSTPESVKKAKLEQSYLKGGWNFSTRTIEDGVFTGFGNVIRNLYGQAKYLLGYMARSQQENQQNKDNIYKLSDFDKYAGKKVALELSTIAALLIFATFMNGKAAEEPDDYMIQMLTLIMTRLPSERITFYSPTLISDLITSPTSAVSAYRRFLRIMDLSMDLIGLSDYDLDDKIKYGSYAGQKRWVRDVCGIFSNYGLHNAYTNTNAKSLKEKNKFYKKILPIRTQNIDAILEIFGVDFIKDTSSKSKSKNPFKSQFQNDFESSFKKDF